MSASISKYIVWENYGCEGWRPTYYETLAEALTSYRTVCEWKITKEITLETKDNGSVVVTI